MTPVVMFWLAVAALCGLCIASVGVLWTYRIKPPNASLVLSTKGTVLMVATEPGDRMVGYHWAPVAQDYACGAWLVDDRTVSYTNTRGLTVRLAIETRGRTIKATRL